MVAVRATLLLIALSISHAPRASAAACALDPFSSQNAALRDLFSANPSVVRPGLPSSCLCDVLGVVCGAAGVSQLSLEGLAVLPESAGEFTAIRSLFLQNGLLASLPESIGRLGL
jgi:hypothetical protein